MSLNTVIFTVTLFWGSKYMQAISHQRIPGLDAVRAFAALMGIILHTSAGYLINSVPEWPKVGSKQNIFFDYLACGIHIFRIPIFFFLAGFFAYSLFERVGVREFIKNRTFRIVIPFLLFTLILNIPMLMIEIMIGQIHSINNVLLSFYNLGYLWFLEYLIIYYILFISFWFITKKENSYIRWWLITPGKTIVLFIMCNFVFLYLGKDWATPIFLSVIPNISLLSVYMLSFMLGVFLYKYYDLMLEFFKFRWFYLIIGGLSYISYAYFVTHFTHTEGHRIIAIIFYSIANSLLFLNFIAICIKWFNKENVVIRFFADASYWIYLIHIPIVIYLQYYFVHSSLPLFVQFIFICVMTLLIASISYQLFIRNTSLGKNIPIAPVQRTEQLPN